MKEKARKILLELKKKDKALSKAFDTYVKHLVDSLEIPEDIAVTLVRDELVNQYERKLILHNLFSKTTLENLDKK